MLFTTADFVLFMAALLGLFLVFRSTGPRKAFLLIGSYAFYTWNALKDLLTGQTKFAIFGELQNYDLRFALLLALLTYVNFTAAQMIDAREGAAKKRVLTVTCIISIGLLAFFKYAAFIGQNVSGLTSTIGVELAVDSLKKIVLPVGISFFTFHMLSYTIDVYRGKIKATSDWVDFAIFGSFFPQLVAGPILRASTFLPALAKPVKLHFDKEILFLCLRGLFKKMIIADNVSRIVDTVYGNPSQYPSTIIWFAAICYSVQIYCDFSGYSDIAIGLTRVFGIELPLNFDRPYFARNPSDFWARWHISLSTWLRDYLYIPLGGNRNGEFATLRNLMITMLLGGLWHGASWNFVLWGFLHGAILVVHRLYVKFSGRVAAPDQRGAGFWLSWGAMQYMILLTWITFRIGDTDKMLVVLRKFVVFDFNFGLAGMGIGNLAIFQTALLLAGFFAMHFLGFLKRDRWEQILARQSDAIGALVCVIAGLLLYWFWPLGEAPFIYFQF